MELYRREVDTEYNRVASILPVSAAFHARCSQTSNYKQIGEETARHETVHSRRSETRTVPRLDSQRYFEARNFYVNL